MNGASDHRDDEVFARPATGSPHALGIARCTEPGSVSGGLDPLTIANLFQAYYRLLPRHVRRAMHLIVAERRSYADAAAIMGVEVKAVRRLVFLGRLRIHRAMSPTLHELSR